MSNKYDNQLDQLIKMFPQKMIDAYSIGALLYTPAVNDQIRQKLTSGQLGSGYSLCLCLEDSIDDTAVEAAEENIVQTLKSIQEHLSEISYMPQLFIRVRYPEQITSLFSRLESAASLLSGFIIPKFNPENAVDYLAKVSAINDKSECPIYALPILEGQELIAPKERQAVLHKLTVIFEEYKDFILNIRVGGNDLCHLLGVRRNVDETIYDIHHIANIFSNIITAFYQDFVISGPVWEYFSGEQGLWQTGLRHEIRLDLLNGFVGKTVIHPMQIPVVLSALKVPLSDLEDALRVLTFDTQPLQVEKSAAGCRMNEVKTHTNWAKKQILLAKIYGVIE